LDITDETVDALKGDYLNSDQFTAAEKAAMKWAEVLTLKQYHAAPGQKPQNVAAMAALKEHYDEAQIVEITMVSGFFNFWNRFTDGLQVDIEDSPIMNLIQRSAHVDTNDYIAFMRDCWWNHSGAR
jgi:alkylhydroperoxidase family enzyme